jgi:PilZ domain
MHIFERVPLWLSERFADRRTEERVPVLLTAELHIGESIVKGVLLNLSPSGAMMAATEPQPSGICAVLRFEGQELPVAVTWAEGRRFGLMFGRTLDWTTIEAIAASSANNGRAR